jgi:hypothetical protein
MNKLILTMVVMGVIAVGCGPGGGPPTNMTVRIANERAQTAEMAWQSGGLFGTSLLASTGTDQIAGCSIYTRSFDSRSTTVTISVADLSLRVNLGSTPDFGAERDFLIGLQDISEIDPAALPANPCS